MHRSRGCSDDTGPGTCRCISSTFRARRSASWSSVRDMRCSRSVGTGGSFALPTWSRASSAGVDRVFPGALWTWEHVVAFLFQCAIVAFIAYAVVAWRLAGIRSVGLRWIIGPLLIFQLTLIFVPASMTTDIFNYALYGEMPVLYGVNPFIHTPSEFPQSPLFYLIPLYWHDAPSVYGPLWVAISTGVARVFLLHSLADEL